MAYRSTRRRTTARSSYGRRPTARARTGPSRRRAPATRRATARRSAAPQVVKLVLETRPASAVSRPDLTGVSLVEKPKGKAKF